MESKNKFTIFMIGLTLTLSACQTTIYGHTLEQWASMSAEEQQKAKLDYQALIISKEAMAYGQDVEADTFRFLQKGLQ